MQLCSVPIKKMMEHTRNFWSVLSFLLTNTLALDPGFIPLPFPEYNNHSGPFPFVLVLTVTVRVATMQILILFISVSWSL